MLIIANGAFKSGSTWQFRILAELTQFPPIPEAYQAGWINPSLDFDAIETFLDEVDIANGNYISKNHLDSVHIRDLLLANENVRVFNIKRDIRDVLVSAYYHMMREKNVELSFKEYMETYGFATAKRVLNYQKKWDVTWSQRNFLGSYEALHHDFHNEVQGMADVLNIPVTEEQLNSIREKTSIQQLRVAYEETDKTAKERFFRKGEIGDWVNHFDESSLEQLEKIQTEIDRNPQFLEEMKSLLRQWLRI